MTSAMFVPPSTLNLKNEKDIKWTVQEGKSSKFILSAYSTVSPCAPLTGTVIIAAAATLRNSVSLPPWFTFESSTLELWTSQASVAGKYQIIVKVTYDSLQSLEYDIEVDC